jgi:hypothetical protein
MHDNRQQITGSNRGFGRFRVWVKHGGFGYGTVPVTALVPARTYVPAIKEKPTVYRRRCDYEISAIL